MNLLLPYAHDTYGNLVHINNSQRGQKYTCPICKSELLLKISKIPKEQKYHRRNHFAHKGNSDNHCSESFLHKLFKEKCVEYFHKCIINNEKLFISWQCNKCHKKMKADILNDISDIKLEYDLGECRPDIALINTNNKVSYVIEIVFTHKPEERVLQFYNEQNIICILIKINGYKDCDNIENKLLHPTNVYSQYSHTCNSNNKNNDDNNIYSENESNFDTKHILYRDMEKRIKDKRCPKCGKNLHMDKDDDGYSIAKCNNYPNCDYILKQRDLDKERFPNAGFTK